MFAGPPPPIASSMLITKSSPSRQRSNDRRSQTTTPSQGREGKSGLRSLLFDYRHDQEPSYRADTTWRGLRRQEKALEKEVQQLLDLQASGLISGLSGTGATPSEVDEYSDTGSSTPTGTFYSTKSRMVNSLYVPTRSNKDGSVIPVRQPKSNKPRGLKSARTGLRRAMAALAQLKLEEDSYVDDALAQRRKALKMLERLSRRKQNVSKELQALEEAEEEPLGQELRELSVKYDSMTQEIRALEEKLVGLRNQRRWVRGKMEDVKNRRDAGLSGYRGALQEVDAEVTTLMHQPPVQPLDLGALHQENKGGDASTGGLEFLQLIPERRTVEMAKAWWEAEVKILEQHRENIISERTALDDGISVWDDVMRLVSSYESRLRQIVTGSQPSSSLKGKEKAPSNEELIRSQLPEMDKVVTELKKHCDNAEEKHWTLLICAIGAELEAFQEAQDLLKGALGEHSDISRDTSQDSPEQESNGANEHENHLEQELEQPQRSLSREESSDNEVPPDLLVSRAEDVSGGLLSLASPNVGPTLSRISSENDVPPEFLAQHGDKQGKED